MEQKEEEGKKRRKKRKKTYAKGWSRVGIGRKEESERRDRL